MIWQPVQQELGECNQISISCNNSCTCFLGLKRSSWLNWAAQQLHLNGKLGEPTSEELPSSKMEIQNRENTLSLTGRLDQAKRDKAIVRGYLDTVILCQVQHHIDGTEGLPGFFLLFMLCPQLSLFCTESLARKWVLHHWCSCATINWTRAGQFWLQELQSVPMAYFPSEYRGHGMQNYGQIISLVAGTQLFAMCITIVSLLFLSAELLPWEMHTCIPDQNSESSLILCFLNTSVIYYVAG